MDTTPSSTFDMTFEIPPTRGGGKSEIAGVSPDRLWGVIGIPEAERWGENEREDRESGAMGAIVGKRTGQESQ